VNPVPSSRDPLCASAAVIHLRPTNRAGLACFLVAVAVTGTGLWLSHGTHVGAWFVGQLLVAAGFMEWFCLLHECGHETLFRSRVCNRLTGHLAGFFSLIPFCSWRRVHALHHRWTGWQDLDPTTEGLVQKPANRWLLRAANFCWRCWIPLFSVVYRLENYWHLPRLRRRVGGGAGFRGLVVNAVVLIALYGLVVLMWGWLAILQWVGLGLCLGLMFQDMFLLSQHTHLPQQRSYQQPVSPFPPVEQEVFTRSLVFPRWFSRWILIGADAHELHHMFPFVPGYRIHAIPYETHHAMSWWRWMRAARQIPAEVFLYQNRTETGFDI